MKLTPLIACYYFRFNTHKKQIIYGPSKDKFLVPPLHAMKINLLHLVLCCHCYHCRVQSNKVIVKYQECWAVSGETKAKANWSTSWPITSTSLLVARYTFFPHFFILFYLSFRLFDCMI